MITTLTTKAELAEIELYQAEQAFIDAVEVFEEAQLKMAAANQRLEDALAAFPEEDV